jgi:hypothetical protein
MAEPFATPEDLQARWRPLDPEETARAAVLLGDASRIVRRRWSDIDARIAAGDLDLEDVVMVVCAMVRRAGLDGDDPVGVTQQAETVGPFTVSRSFGQPRGALYLTAAEIATLDPPPVKVRRAFVIDLTPDR